MKNIRRRQIQSIKIPNEYQQVEYIESTGQIPLSISIPLSQTIQTFHIKFIPVEWCTLGGWSNYYDNGNGILFCGREGFDIRLTKSDNKLHIRYGNGNWGFHIEPSVNFYYGELYDIYVEKTRMIINNNIVEEYEETLHNVTNKCTLFNGEASYSWMKFYSFEGYSAASELIIHLIPCYRKTDNKAGVYDVVTNMFYTNSNTGQFTVGPEVY